MSDCWTELFSGFSLLSLLLLLPTLRLGGMGGGGAVFKWSVFKHVAPNIDNIRGFTMPLRTALLSFK